MFFLKPEFYRWSDVIIRFWLCDCVFPHFNSFTCTDSSIKSYFGVSLRCFLFDRKNNMWVKLHSLEQILFFARSCSKNCQNIMLLPNFLAEQFFSWLVLVFLFVTYFNWENSVQTCYQIKYKYWVSLIPEHLNMSFI